MTETTDIRLLIAAPQGVAAKLQGILATAGISPAAVFCTGGEALAAAQQDQALLLTSWSETFGLVALEAQASGTPVLAWRCAGGVQEAVDPGGLVLESRDPDVWAEALQSLLGDADRYGEAVRSAREFASSRTWEATAETLAAQYARLLEETA